MSYIDLGRFEWIEWFDKKKKKVSNTLNPFVYNFKLQLIVIFDFKQRNIWFYNKLENYLQLKKQLKVKNW